MKKLYIWLLSAAVVVAALIFFFRNPTPQDASLWVYGDARTPGTRINATFSGEESTVLILPANADPTALSLYFTLGSSRATLEGSLGEAVITSGKPFDLTALCEGESPWELTLKTEDRALTLNIGLSQNIPTVYLTSADPEKEGRSFVESGAAGEHLTTGTMVMTEENGSIVYAGALSQLRGRGNTTWDAPKKPYQIKLEQSTDLLRSHDPENRRKTWVLLANYYDPALLRNQLVYDLAGSLGMEYHMESTPVTLYYDGEYRGTYQLCEKVGVNPGRVSIEDLEQQTLSLNEGDLSQLPMGSGVTANNATYYYREGLTNPRDITGGYLLEMEFGERVTETDCHFVTSRNNIVVVKSPQFCSREQMDYIAALYQSYEDAAYNGGIDPTTGKTLGELMDLKSLGQYYLINEWAKNPDGFTTSCYISKDAGRDTLVMGPVWDFDLALGVGNISNLENCRDPEGWFAAISGLPHRLTQCKEFRQTVYHIFYNSMLPLLEEVILTDTPIQHPGGAKSIFQYGQELAAGAACDRLFWQPPADSTVYGTWQEDLQWLREFVEKRTDWMKGALSSWDVCQEAAVPQFFDVALDSWYYPHIEAVTEAGFMQGYVYGKFDPDGTVTRAQGVVVLYNATPEHGAPATPGFQDVSGGSWYSPALAWGETQKIARGYPDGTFCPGDPLTRGEAVVLLHRYFGCPEGDSALLNSCMDGSIVSGEMAAAMAWAMSEEILKGCGDGTLRPGENITRGEFAALIARALCPET